MRRAALVAVMSFMLPVAARADRTVSGTVFVDVDGDALLSAPDRVFADGVVFWETTHDAPLDPLGAYSLSVPERAGIVWVLARDGLDPGPFWAEVPAGGDRTVDLAVRPLSRTGPLTFVVASDTHAGIHGMPASDQVFALQQATDLEPRPHFIAVTGDITQSNKPEQFATVLAAAAAIDTPYVPVPGNHDWYDGGAAYRMHLGPPTYAFNAGGAHFIVLNDAASFDERTRFVDRDMALLNADATVVALMHAPPGEELVAALAGRGVDALLTGHMHSNRVLRHDGLVEYNTEPLAMGGMDLTPAGYRVFSLAADGDLASSHRTLVNRPVLRIVAPTADQIAPRCRVPLVVAVEAGTAVRSLAVRADGIDAVTLAHAGGWAHAAGPLRLCEPGAHRIEVEAVLADGYRLTDAVDVEVGDPPAVGELGEWAALSGSSRHLGWSPVETGFPLRTQWVASAGGHVQGAPVLAGGRVFVPVSDLAAGNDGGVAAFDAITGEMLWQRRIGAAVRNAPAAGDGVVVFAGLDGSVNAVDAATGEERWTAALAPWAVPSSRSLYAAPIIEDGVVYAGGGRELAAFELQTGEVLWSVSPIEPGVGELESHASPALADGLLVTAFDRGQEGVMAFDAGTGEMVWQTGPELAQGIQGSPAIGDRTVYVVNERTDVYALDLESGRTLWSTRLDPAGFDWACWSAATPALHDGVLYVATQTGALFALDAGSGRIRWSAPAGRPIIRTTHYRGEVPAFGAAPALTPGLVWTASPDGIVRALSARDGRELWFSDLGVPVLSSPVPAGGLMFVASFDGTVRAFAPGPDIDLPDEGGCGVGGGSGVSPAAALALLLLLRRWPGRSRLVVSRSPSRRSRRTRRGRRG